MICAGVSRAYVDAPYISGCFGAPFRRIADLPAGLVAVPAGFDQGDKRIFSGALSGVWSLRLGTHVPRLEIGYAAEPATSNAVAALATPPLGGPPAVLAWAPAGSLLPGALSPPSFDSPHVSGSASCSAGATP